ncbi:hypothetical protein [Acrocarpospora sp. B8E8]|uniref:hypothetical protein n=1 Tax=Acrocarpospora sp. B8E8 TaxID=3153572 RepID=UPI00325DEC7C
MSGQPDQSWQPRIVRGDQARGPGDEPAPEQVLHTDADGNTGPAAERMATKEEVADAQLDPRTFLPVEYDAETVDAETELVTDRPVDQDDDGDEPVLYGKVLSPKRPARKPIVPEWMRTRQGLRTVVVHEAGLAWYRVRRHAFYSPLYAARVLRWAPVGAVRAVAAGWRWAWHAESAPLRRREASPQTGDVNAYVQLHKVRDQHVRARLPIATGALATGIGGAWAAWALAPAPALVIAGGAAATILAKVGRPIDQPIVEVAVTVEKRRRLTALEVREALCTLRIAGLKDPEEIKFPVEIHRDGPGQLARVNLPRGVEAVDVIEKRGRLSSALRRPVDQVWPIGGPDHAGQLDLWVSYVPVSQMAPPTWSLTKDGARTSVFEPIEIGFDQRQRPIAVPLFELNWLIGGQPGSGKSYFLRAIALGAAIDPLTEFKIAEYKGTGDFADFDEAGLCSSYVCGVDEEEFDEGADILAWALAECAKRGKRIKKYRAAGRAPNGKVTPELAAEPGSGLHPIVLVFDEVHELFLNRPGAAVAAERVIKRGRALNIILLMATQIPDKDSLPKNITRCVAMRACLAVDDHIANDMILGTGAHKRGVTGTTFRPKVDAGWAMVVGLEAPIAVHGAFPSQDEGRALLNRAVELRGGRRMDREDLPRVDIVVDVQRVWPAERAGVQWPELAELLAAVLPERYGDETPETISARLRAIGVPSVDVKHRGTVLKGCRLEAVEAAAAQRELTRG